MVHQLNIKVQVEMAEVVEDNSDNKLHEPPDDAANDEEGTVLYVSNLTRYLEIFGL